MIKAKVSSDYKDIERIFAGGSIQKEILKIWSTEADEYVFEAWRVLEMEGPLPLSIRANGEPIIDYRIYGNAEQTGTPTPENPADIVGCGERTENLINIVQPVNMSNPGYIYNGEFFFSGESLTISSTFTSSVAIVDKNDTEIINREIYANIPYTVQTPNGVKSLRIYAMFAVTGYFMLNEGRTPLPYEPYGYKLPILSNSNVVDIYLGEVETTRRIKKYIFTGEENGTIYSTSTSRKGVNIIGIPGIIGGNANIAIMAICTHYKPDTRAALYRNTDNGISNTYQNNEIIFFDANCQTVEDFQQFCAQQYAAGTPVTVWYVLAEPETGIVNEPLMKIGDYADTVSMEQASVSIPTFAGTTVIDYEGENHLITSDGYELVDKNQNGFLLSGSTLRPSKMYIKYKGR